MAKPMKTTEVRNSPMPRAASPTGQASGQASQSASRQISREQIARRAYEISQSQGAGSEMDNWLRAERELRGR